jgi:alkanesulfonate monooxygenase SsuD/methylene tetrahydromethanopterin reductase-like flavin-dependent oxidoreductase (luciferase family)
MIAAVGPAMLKVAAEECDGVKLHGFCTRKYLTDEIMPRIAAGLAKACRARSEYEISGGGFLATGPDDAVVAQRFEWVRQRVAFYGSTPAYYPVLAVHRLEDLGRKLNALTRQGKWSEMAREVPDNVVHLFAAVGRHDQIVAAIERRFGGLVDALTLRGDGVGDVPPDLVQDIRRLPHVFLGFAQAN